MAFANFDEFYPFYLGEHSNRTSRRLHVIGTVVALTQFAGAVLTQQPRLVLTGLLIGYGLPGSGISSSRRTGLPPSSIRSGASAATCAWRGKC